MAEKVIKSCGNQQAQLQQVSPLFKSQKFLRYSGVERTIFWMASSLRLNFFGLRFGAEWRSALSKSAHIHTARNNPENNPDWLQSIYSS
jgi:hypothetical protein